MYNFGINNSYLGNASKRIVCVVDVVFSLMYERILNIV